MSNSKRCTLGNRESSVSLSGFRIVAITVHPFSENSLAVTFPKPDEAPVIKIVLFIFLFFNICYKEQELKASKTCHLGRSNPNGYFSVFCSTFVGYRLSKTQRRSMESG